MRMRFTSEIAVYYRSLRGIYIAIPRPQILIFITDTLLAESVSRYYWVLHDLLYNVNIC